MLKQILKFKKIIFFIGMVLLQIQWISWFLVKT